MVLGFKQYFDKDKTKPTYFREKILCGAGYAVAQNEETNEEWIFKPKDYHLKAIQQIGNINPKLHTIREGNRWKEGDLIHMAYGVRTKNYQQFNKGIPELERVKSVQKVEIFYGEKFGAFQAALVAVNDRVLNERERKVLAINDGFKNLDYFYFWFNKNFIGQIIHFTDLRY